MKRSLVALFLFLLSAAAVAQGVSPAQMGVTPTTTPEVLQVLDKNDTWIPIGSFPPGGPFTAFGGAVGGTSMISVFANHAALLLGSTAPTAVSGVFPTLYQQRFYAAVEGGDAAYNWVATSTCPAGVAATGDTVTCLLPPGQPSATPGRWLLSGGTRINPLQLGFHADGVTDNWPLVKTLMGAIGAPSIYYGGYDVVFGGIKGSTPTGYYFSQPFELSRGANWRCEGGMQAAYAAVRFVFPAGVDGVIESDGSMSADGGGMAGRLSGCGVAAVAFGSAATGPGKTTLDHLGANGDVSGLQPLPWLAGDGIIVVPDHNPLATPAVANGAYISGYDTPTNTLTLASPFTIVNNFNFPFQGFHQSSTNNFVAGDSMTVGVNTFIFVTGAPAANQIKIGANFAATAASVVGAFKTGVADTSSVPQWGALSPTPTATSSYSGGIISFSSKIGGAPGRQATTYTPAGTMAGSFELTFNEVDGHPFSNGDTITAGNNTYTFKTTLVNPGDIKIVTGTGTANDLYSTNANLFTAWAGTCGGTSDCKNPTVAANVRAYSSNPATSIAQLPTWPTGRYFAAYATGGSPLTVSATTANGVGTWMASAFNGAGSTFYGENLWYGFNNATTVHLPVAQKYVVTTTASSATVTVVSGPCLSGTGTCAAGSTMRGLRNGDWIWSPDYAYGATITYRNQSGGPNNYTVEDAFMESFINATTTHTSYLWVIPSGIKREVNSINEANIVTGFGQGLNMSCAAHDSIICTGSVDKDNIYSSNLIGRDTGGDNTGGSKSDTEEYAHNWVTDIFEGARVGSTYISPNSNSPDNSGGAVYSFIGNCNATNYSVSFGGYMGGVNPSTPYCATGAGIMPVTSGGSTPLFIGEQQTSLVPQGSAGIGVGLYGSGIFYGPWTFNGTSTKGTCFSFGDAFTMSNSQCSSPSNFTWSWNYSPYFNQNAWILNHYSGQYEPVMIMASTDNFPGGFTGYVGPGGTGIILPFGLTIDSVEDNNPMYGARNLSMASASPVSPFYTQHLRGDFVFNSTPSAGSPIGWSNTPSGTTTLTGAVTAGVTTSVGVALCPSPALTGDVRAVDTTHNPNQVLGVMTSCSPAGSAGTMTFSTSANVAAASGDGITFMQFRPAGRVANDTAGTNFTLGSFLSLTPVAIASLPACPGSSGMFAVVNNGAAPTYGGAVGTTGAVISPVFCDNVSWKYH